MKTVAQFKEIGAADRAKNLKSRTRKDDETKKEIAKLIVAAEECGDFGKGEMNSWAMKIVGCELRREIQGTYDLVKVLQTIRSSEIVFTEEEFDKTPKSALYALARIIRKKDAAKVSSALEIIRSKIDVTNRLRELEGKGKKPAAPSVEPESKESAGAPGAGETGSLNSDTPETPKGDTYFVPEGTAMLAIEEIQARILSDIRNLPDGDSCVNMLDFLAKLAAQTQTRWEHLEAEAAKPAKEPLAA